MVFPLVCPAFITEGVRFNQGKCILYLLQQTQDKPFDRTQDKPYGFVLGGEKGHI
jgi:hypothetical protein